MDTIHPKEDFDTSVHSYLNKSRKFKQKKMKKKKKKSFFQTKKVGGERQEKLVKKINKTLR